jgi:hypothetical protein
LLLPASTWVEAIKKFGHIDACILIDVRKFITVMSKSSLFGELMTRFDGLNLTGGVFRINYQHQYLYYFTKETRQVAYPHPLNGTWKVKVLQQNAANMLVIPSTRIWRPASTVKDTLVRRTTRVGDPDTDEIENESPSKRQRADDVDASCSFGQKVLRLISSSDQEPHLALPATLVMRWCQKVPRRPWSAVSFSFRQFMRVKIVGEVL